MIDKSMGLRREVDGVKFYGGLYSPNGLMGEDGTYISSPEVLTTLEDKLDDLIRYRMAKI